MLLELVPDCDTSVSVAARNFTERRGRVVNTPDSYLGGTGFKSLPVDRLSWQRFCGFPQFIQTSAGIVP
jgi:hypothetical protein